MQWGNWEHHVVLSARWRWRNITLPNHFKRGRYSESLFTDLPAPDPSNGFSSGRECLISDSSYIFIDCIVWSTLEDFVVYISDHSHESFHRLSVSFKSAHFLSLVSKFNRGLLWPAGWIFKEPSKYPVWVVMSLLNVLLVEVIESQELKSLYFVLLVLANPCKLKHLLRCNNCILILAQFFK